jgi:hypothetical protein
MRIHPILEFFVFIVSFETIKLCVNYLIVYTSTYHTYICKGYLEEISRGLNRSKEIVSMDKFMKRLYANHVHVHDNSSMFLKHEHGDVVLSVGPRKHRIIEIIVNI